MQVSEEINLLTRKEETDISNAVLTRKYSSNVRSGLWEVTLTTNFEPDILAKHRSKYS